jgi:hypothetical protein
MAEFNRGKCCLGSFTNATLEHISIQEMDHLHRTYGDVLEIEACAQTLRGDYERGAERCKRL